MKIIIYSLLACTIILTSCNNDKENPSDLFSKVYTTDNLPKQIFSINSDKDTILKGKSGTILYIYKNTFTNKGQTVKGLIDLELKEALTPLQMVLGNLTTLTNGEFLQSDGMLFINASSNGEQLEIAINKTVGIILPTNKVDTLMKVFAGEEQAFSQSENDESHELVHEDDARIQNGINWLDPKEILNKKVIIKSDSLIPSNDIDNNERDFARPQTDEEINAELQFLEDMQEQLGNRNSFSVDPNVNYIFEIKKLGWANIDRLYMDPRTKEIDFITKIDNHSDFKNIYITMITEKMFIPGYQMKNETFSFTHNDQEKPMLPVGASATIMATAYKNDKPFFAIEKITIADKQVVSFKLTETTIEKLKVELDKKL
jgi:hypothetical protein